MSNRGLQWFERTDGGQLKLLGTAGVTGRRLLGQEKQAGEKELANPQSPAGHTERQVGKILPPIHLPQGTFSVHTCRPLRASLP